MAWLTVAGTTVNVQAESSSSRRTTVYVGQQRRAIDGTLRESVTDRKREWDITTSLLTDSDKSSLESAIEGTPPLTCSGDLLGGSVNCHVTDYEVEPVFGQTTKWRASFRLLEA